MSNTKCDTKCNTKCDTTPPAPNAKQIQNANKRIMNTLHTKGTDAAFKELMKHPTTGQSLSYEESRMYYG